MQEVITSDMTFTSCKNGMCKKKVKIVTFNKYYNQQLNIRKINILMKNKCLI